MTAITEMFRHGLGGRRDAHDPRDHHYTPQQSTRALPSAVDLRPQCPPVYNQGRIASCTANAAAGAIQFSRMKHGQSPDFVPSRLFVYYNQRAIENCVDRDSGARTRDAIKVIKNHGAPPEALWPYDDTPPPAPGEAYPPDARAALKPPAAVYQVASKFEVLHYRRLRKDLPHMKACLAEGYPFTLGIVVFPSFVAQGHRQNTVTPMPDAGEAPLGEHVVLGVGYDDAKQYLICRNSWGAEQADLGYFYLPYAYAGDKDLVGDLWTIRTVEC